MKSSPGTKILAYATNQQSTAKPSGSYSAVSRSSRHTSRRWALNRNQAHRLFAQLAKNEVRYDVPMLLIVKGKPTRTRCCQCLNMFAPSERELSAAAKRRNPAFICAHCMANVELHYQQSRAEWKLWDARERKAI